MTDRPPRRPEDSQADFAPETHNDEQDDHLTQAQEVAEEARNKDGDWSPLDSEKVHGGIDDEDAKQDHIDRMRDMDQSGRIDMNAYAGEPNMDDNEDKYGEDNKIDDLSGDGTDEGSYAGPEE
jgi:hypothetical protein